MAETFQAGAVALMAGTPSEEDIDEYIGRFTGLRPQPAASSTDLKFATSRVDIGSAAAPGGAIRRRGGAFSRSRGRCQPSRRSTPGCNRP